MPVLIAMLSALASFSAVRAQTAPAGNAATVPRIIDDAAPDANPFGGPIPTTLTMVQKEAFSKKVNLAPLRDLAVSHASRVKVLDTLAREMVRQLLGRKGYVDFSIDPAKPTEVRNVHYDPLFTTLDLMIDPGYYVDKPLIHVEYLPLREAYLERMYSDAAEREWWKRIGRLKPLKLLEKAPGSQSIILQDPASAPIADADKAAAMARAIDATSTSMLLFQYAWKNLMMVAPEAASQPWGHLGSLPIDSPAGAAVRDLGLAWRAGDADRANAAIATIASEVPGINAGQYPQARRALEATYNKLNAFEWGYWLYALSLLSLLLAFGTGRRWLVHLGVGTLFVALAMHGFGFVSRCIIAERFAIQNQFESMTGLSLFAGLVGAAIMLLRRQWLFGAAAAGVGFMVLLTATQAAIPGVSVEREAPILNTSVLLKYHVTTVLVSYGLISLGFMVSLFYLGTHYAAKIRSFVSGPRPAPLAIAGDGRVGSDAGMAEMSATALNMDEATPHGPARVLHDLDKSQMVILQLAFWALGVGIMLGAWWADHSWGRWWAFDPKELWALVTWLVYLVVIHIRFANVSNRALMTAWLSVLGFIIMLWTYFGVNLILPGLHAYA